MDDKLMSTIDKITRLTQQNAEFDMELRKQLKVASANSVLSEDERINQIYEYCIEEIIRKQANEFYKDFPLQSIKDTLIGDFVRMESFRRKDNFGDFCLALYQQIECMTNRLCEKKELSDITEKMWGYPAYLKVEKGKELSIYNRSGDYTIASLLFRDKTNAFEKSRKSLQTQYAIDKIRIIVYFLGYKAMMKGSDYDSFIEITLLLNDIYQCRNMNHRGNSQNQWEKETFARIIPLKSLYYFKFLGVLAQYVEYIKEGWGYIPELKKYSDSIEKRKISAPQLKIVDKIDLKDDGRKRFK
ncbi:hypothetical protein HKQ50_03600 [Bacteroides vulgatus]|uniref:hypothetical protein n=1 Tax=Phocaeicola vulgatus TaxID=821 RepID=UPI00155E70F0|nr:hypothetical protein [Phocaeicola vulgatus]NMW56656.1 hypothetical protein [Phocaeicola vulgatus]UBD84133.1 hypothetical protein K6V28_20745 [Phocaeicola vulgatus]